MAYLGKPREEQQYGKLMGMIQPEATPTRRVGTETPVGAVTAGPSAGKSAAEFTKSTQGSPGSVFNRQLAGANISGITSLAEQPLLREAGQEAVRVAGEGAQYKKSQEENLAKQPQITDYNKAIADIAAGNKDTTSTAQTVLTRQNIPVQKFDTADIKEFTPLQALRGGSVESLLKKEAKGPYSTGMAGLDALLFQKKGGAQQLAERGMATRGLLQGAVNVLEGGKEDSLAGDALERLKGLGLNIPLTSLTAEAEKKAADLVQQQRAGLTGALTGEIDKRRGEFQSGIEAVQQGRAAAASQAYQDTLQQYLTEAGALRAQALNELLPPELQTKTGAPVEAVDIGSVIQTGPGGTPMAPAEMQVPDRAAIEAAVRGVDINQILSGFIKPGTVNAPTLADVAAMSPQKQAEYERLTGLLGMTPGEDVSKYSLGQTTTASTPSTSASPEAIRAAILDALRKAGSAAPKQTIRAGGTSGAPAYYPGEGMVSGGGGTTYTR